MEYADFQDLATERLCLRKITMADLQRYFHLFSNPQIAKFMLWEPHIHISQSQAALEKLLERYAEGMCYRWGITLPGEDLLIGIVELLRFNEETNSCSFVYMLDESHWNRGYGTEALYAAIDFAFTRLNVEVVIADHMGPNLPSGKAMQKVGMTYVHTIPSFYQKNGEVYDLVRYQITRQNWENPR